MRGGRSGGSYPGRAGLASFALSAKLTRVRDRRQRAETLIRVQRERAPHGFIGGLDVQSEGSQTIEVNDAAEGNPLGRCPIAHIRDIERAAEAARKAAGKLRRKRPESRGQALESLAELVAENTEDLAILECLQTGRAYRDVLREDIERGLKALRMAAAWAREPRGQHHDLGGGRIGTVNWETRPVWGAVLPSTEPLGAALRRIAAVVASGGALVILAPPEAPLTVLRLAALSRDSGLPTGTINVLTGNGRDAAERLAECPLVDGLAYSGTIETARRMLVGAAKSNLKPVHLDLDSKTPCFILDDADISPAVDAVWRSGLTSSSQLGRSVGRVLVHESLYTSVADRLASLARGTVIGHPLDEHTELGPMVSEEGMRRVLAYVELGRREGAKLVAGGAREVEGPRFAGNFVQPTLFVEPPREGRLVREPIAGPVLSVEPFRTDDEAVEKADMSLGRGSAVVFAPNVGRAQRLAGRLNVGQVFINEPVRLYPTLPHASGSDGSAPQLGRLGMEACGYPKTTVSNLGKS